MAIGSPIAVRLCAASCLLAIVSGCAIGPDRHVAVRVQSPVHRSDQAPAAAVPVSYQEPVTEAPVEVPSSSDSVRPIQLEGQSPTPTDVAAAAPLVIEFPAIDSLESAEQAALDDHPRLSRLHREYEAAAARARSVGALPDPRFGANIFGAPIETAAGSQRANLSISQMIPWLARLDAQQQRACLEATAIAADMEAEALVILAKVRIAWMKLYVVERQIETAQANQDSLKSWVNVATARVAALKSQGDVSMGTLEIAAIEERLMSYRRQRSAIVSQLNRLTARPAEAPVASPEDVLVGEPTSLAADILQIALQSQPELQAAHLHREASQWGIEAARLSRRPEVTLSASYFFTDDNRPATPVVRVGEDPWALGVQVSLPIWRDKYDAIEEEAVWRRHAADDSIEELEQRYDALIIEHWSEARRAYETASLYRDTIIPEARKTLNSDQQAYANEAVPFDRVVEDFRKLLNLEAAYHRAVGDLGIAAARLHAIAGVDLPIKPFVVRPPKDED